MTNIEKLLDFAGKARNNAYAPYSDFKVGAAVLSADGKIFGGCNAENAAYPCGTCAEAGAISAMIAAGQRKIAEILIVADSKNILPCGNCLQKIAEFGDDKTLIHCSDLKGNICTYKISELLPQQFSLKDITNGR